MTIAGCYLSPEGVVLGSDSTSTYHFGHPHHFDFGQKLFEIGGNSTFGIVTWGLGGLSLGSYRTYIARLGDSFTDTPPQTVLEVAQRWANLLWSEYAQACAFEIAEIQRLDAMLPFGTAPIGPGTRSEAEENAYRQLQALLFVGFCVGGYVVRDRTPGAFEILVDPLQMGPIVNSLPLGYHFWGLPILLTRLLKGCGDEVRDALLASGHWTGTSVDLDNLLTQFGLVHSFSVPIREAIDFIHTCLLTTIKSLKFSLNSRDCGGPIEIAVITTDRQFRWVRHKGMDAAIRESDP